MESMNERINELWWKARIGYNNQNCDPEVLEKFVELIVKEAGAYLMSPEFIGRSDLDWSMVLNDHFGVEE